VLLLLGEDAADVADDAGVVGVELLLLELLLQAATSNAAETAAAVSPAVFVTEYNGVPRLFRSRHARRAWRDQIRVARSLLTGRFWSRC
jgi:hypothetical protein